jgi:dihydrofolate synthase/folylpolyglutamate synthase
MPKSLPEFLCAIEKLHPKSIDLGLERIRAVAQSFIPLSYPCPVVLIGGTNGKGSTVASLAALAQAAGMKVGTYTSPHLYEFNERIKINEKAITDEELLQALQAVDAARNTCSLTYFEFTTLAALHYFHQHPLDLLILEVGMGGRLDATNIIEPDISLITSIGLDHMAYLGNSKEAIAYEKAGIMRKGRPIICGDIPLSPLLREQAESIGAEFYGLGEDFFLEKNLQSNLVPSNLACAIQAAKLLNIPVDLGVLSSVQIPGRKQKIPCAGKTVLLDVAHNEDSLNELNRYLQTLEYSAYHLVLGIMGDKEVNEALNALTALCKTIHLAAPDTPRAMQASIVQNKISSKSETYVNVKKAFESALNACGSGECVVVTGSFFMIAELPLNYLLTRT